MAKKTLYEGELLTEKDLNEKNGLQRPEDTHWGSFF